MSDPRQLLFLASLSFALLWTACGASRPRAQVPNVQSDNAQFESYCAGCHSSDGKGVEAEAPPLVGSSWVAGPEERLIKILLHGVRGPIEVGARTYNREMPAFGQILSDAEIAALLSLVRSRFGGVSVPVAAAVVSGVREGTRERKDYWTADELLQDR